MKSILLLVHEDEGQDARLEAALGIARALDAHLHCIDVTPRTTIASELYVGLGETSMLAIRTEGDEANGVAVRDRLSREDVAWSWTEVQGDIANCAIAAARLADLVVLNRTLDEHGVPDMPVIITKLLEHPCAPIVAVPPAQERFEFDRALIAWDGRSSAAAALRASVPLLALAKRIELFTVGDIAGGDLPAEEAKAYLAQYGLQAEIRRISDGSAKVASRITAECERWRADYVVMGAFGRGAWRETFGGVTRSLLKTSPVPLILCH
ncbi:universal stress protein [Sphingopyxis terrae]|uniref:universal stress protein n=1 Tax=Sphingopyxis terrae TaxID=33052 RepID=UPI003F7E1228